MPKNSHMHNQTEWLKARLDEMDASIANFEVSLGKTRSSASRAAHDAFESMKLRRDAFKHWADQKEDQSENAWASTKDKLEEEWDEFEESIESFINATKNKTKSSADTFKTRAASQQRSWNEAIKGAKLSVVSFADKRKADLEKATLKMEAEADKVGHTFMGINAAGNEAWPAMREALSTSRGAFDHALDDMRAAFNIARKSD